MSAQRAAVNRQHASQRQRRPLPDPALPAEVMFPAGFKMTPPDSSAMDDDVFDFTDSEDADAPFPPTYMVVRFAAATQPRAIAWLVDKIRGPRSHGGAELLVRRQHTEPGDGVILHVSASCRKLLELAEEMELKKRDQAGLMREFIFAHLRDFVGEKGDREDLLTTAERQLIVRHELDNIRALSEDPSIPGYPNFRMYEGQSIVQVMIHRALVMSMYPLHDKENLKRLSSKWYYSKHQPIEDIRLYFGEAVALYFKFLDFYTVKLLFPLTLLGVLQMALSTLETLPFFCVCNVIAVTVFLEVWRRRSNEAAFQWGTIGMTSLDEPRPNFHGTMMVDTVTGRLLPQFPRRTTYIRMYCVTLPIVVVCLFLAFLVMLLSFYAEERLTQMSKDPESGVTYVTVMIPSVVYSILVSVVNLYYRKLATYLTEWENHRTQSQFERHRVIKLVAFEFVNTFMALFYIAFIYQDMDMLRSQLATMLIILQVVNNVQEAVLPLLMRYLSKVPSPPRVPESASTKRLPGGAGGADGEVSSAGGLRYRGGSATLSHELYPGVPEVLQGIPELDADDPRQQQALTEGSMDEYEGTYDDYLEVFIQFGYVFLFSAVYPQAALWALFNNVIESRVDAFKLCRLYQRPLARRVKDTGAWQRAFEALGAMSIITNCGLLCVSPPLRGRFPELSQTQWVLRWMVVEHLLMGVRYVLHQAIPDKPEWVRVALAKLNYQSKLALRKERALKRRMSSRRSARPVPVPKAPAH